MRRHSSRVRCDAAPACRHIARGRTLRCAIVSPNTSAVLARFGAMPRSAGWRRGLGSLRGRLLLGSANRLAACRRTRTWTAKAARPRQTALDDFRCARLDPRPEVCYANRGAFGPAWPSTQTESGSSPRSSGEAEAQPARRRSKVGDKWGRLASGSRHDRGDMAKSRPAWPNRTRASFSPQHPPTRSPPRPRRRFVWADSRKRSSSISNSSSRRPGRTGGTPSRRPMWAGPRRCSPRGCSRRPRSSSATR